MSVLRMLLSVIAAAAVVVVGFFAAMVVAVLGVFAAILMGFRRKSSVRHPAHPTNPGRVTPTRSEDVIDI